MIGKKKINQIKLLVQKKNRDKEHQFLVEGDKNILEVLKSQFQVVELYATADYLKKNEKYINNAEKIIEVIPDDIKKVSLLKSPQCSLAICKLPQPAQLPARLTGISFYLDGIQDPGNLGTIIRTCDWFGMEYLFCSSDTADFYNPKVVQSTMGSFLRIKTIYISFEELVPLFQESQFPVFGTFLEGESLYELNLPSEAMIVLGNEGNGIRSSVAKKINKKISIPSFYRGKTGAESLNVAVTAGIIGSEFMRQASGGNYSK